MGKGLDKKQRMLKGGEKRDIFDSGGNYIQKVTEMHTQTRLITKMSIYHLYLDQ